MALSMLKNSTNVRRESPLDPWPARRVAVSHASVLMLAAWAVFVAIGRIEGIFVRLEPEAYVALAAFVVVFGVAACQVDPEAAAVLGRVKRPLMLALALDASLLAIPA